MKTIGNWPRRGWRNVHGRNLFVFVVFVLSATIVYFYIDFPQRLENNGSIDYSYLTESPRTTNFERRGNLKRVNISTSEVIVFIHIQKTAGTTFEKFLVRHQEDLPCQCSTHRKRCNCFNSKNETWLFSRYSTGWICGLHADYTELVENQCVQKTLDKKSGRKTKRNYYYTTFLRNPTDRFISEFRHVQRGATWISSKHVCNGKPTSLNDLPSCFDPRIGWEGVSLEEFILCPYNLAFNRQTRMLANLSLVDCYEHIRYPSREYDKILLRSAKENLRKMAFFGLKERMDDSQKYFENTFNIKFTRKMSIWGKSKSNDTVLTDAQLVQIEKVNRLDWELYKYAVELFNERIAEL